MPVFASISLLTCTPALALPLKPCSGPKIFTIFTPRFSKLSTVVVLPITDVGLTTMPTRLPFSKGMYSSVCSAPVLNVVEACFLLMVGVVFCVFLPFCPQALKAKKITKSFKNTIDLLILRFLLFVC